MLKILCSAALGAACLVCSANTCQADCHCRGKSPVQGAAPMAARADGGYRTYSYEPGPAYRTYSRTGGLRQPSYLDARSKALGRY